jgi:hypothetical protein
VILESPKPSLISKIFGNSDSKKEELKNLRSKLKDLNKDLKHKILILVKKGKKKNFFQHFQINKKAKKKKSANFQN